MPTPAITDESGRLLLVTSASISIGAENTTTATICLRAPGAGDGIMKFCCEAARWGVELSEDGLTLKVIQEAPDV